MGFNERQAELKTVAAQLDALRRMRDRHATGSELRGLFNAVCDRMDVLHSALARPRGPLREMPPRFDDDDCWMIDPDMEAKG